MAIRVTNAGPGGRHAARAAHLWFRNTWSWDARRRRGPSCAPTAPTARSRSQHPCLGELELGRRRRARTATRPTLLFCENETNTARLYGAADVTRYPEGRDQRPRRRRARRRSTPDQVGTKCAAWYQLTVEPGETGRAAAAAAPDRRRTRRPSASDVRQGARGAAQRGRRVLRRADPADRRPTTSAGAAPGVRRDAVEQAALPLRRGALARRRPDAAATAAGAPQRAQRAVAPLRRLRHHVDARQVGVPVVRRVGPGVPLRRARPRRPGVRQVPAARCCAASGSSTPTARCPPTSGTSATSTRRCRPGPRWRCSPSTAGATSTSWPGCFHKLLINFTWWVNREDADGSTTCSRAGSSGWTTSARSTARTCPPGGRLEQSDATGWMASYALTMLQHRAASWRPSDDDLDRPRGEVPRALRR